MKRVLAVMLVICMLLSAFATGAVAVGTDNGVDNGVYVEEGGVVEETTAPVDDTATPTEAEEAVAETTVEPTVASGETIETQPQSVEMETEVAQPVQSPAQQSEGEEADPHPHSAEIHEEYANVTWTALTAECFASSYNGSASNIASGYYYLTGDFTLPNVLDVRSGENVVICLNGYNLTGYAKNRMFRIAGGATVTVCNCGNGGKLLPKSNTTMGTVAYVDKASLTLDGVSVDCKGFSATGTGGGAIYAGNSANLTLNDTSIANGTATCGGAIYATSSTVNITGGSFTGNNATNEGGAIYAITGTSTMTISNSSFTDNAVTGTSGNGGGAIYIYSGTVQLDSVTMTGNKNSAKHGSAITIGVAGSQYPSLTLKDCTLTDNLSKSLDKRSGVSVVSNKATVTVCGNTVIDGNRNGTNANWEGGTERNLFLRSSAKLTVGALTEGANIHVNVDYTVGSDPDDFLTYVSEENGTNNTPVMEGADARMIIYENREQAGDINCAVGYNAADRFYFAANTDHWHADCVCAIEGATCESHANGDGEESGWIAWGDDDSEVNKLPTTANHYYLTQDVVLDKTYECTAGVYICLNGYSISRSEDSTSTDALIKIGAGSTAGNLTILNCKAELGEDGMLESTAGVKNGEASRVGNGGGFRIDAGTLTLLGVEVSGHSDITPDPATSPDWRAGAILVRGGSSVNIAYSKFAENDVSVHGGAITLRSGTANIRNTYFYKNTAAQKGGAIYVPNAAAASLTLNGCLFEENTSQLGGALYVDDGDVKVTIGDSTFKNNGSTQTVTTKDGGALYLYKGTITVTNTENNKTVFSGNKATNGGAIYMPQGGSVDAALNMTGCELTGNSATGTAGAMYIGVGKVKLDNVTMTGNTNDGSMGSTITLGVGTNDEQNPNRHTASLELKDCTITDNINAKSGYRGAVTVYGESQTLTISGATVIDRNLNNGEECNIFLREAGAKLTAGQLETGASISVATGFHNVDQHSNFLAVDDPDVFMVKGVTGDWTWNPSWVNYENNGLDVNYSDTDDLKFYFVAHAEHGHCPCGDAKDANCDHNNNYIDWKPWGRADKLPSAEGNYYLTKDVTLTKAQNLSKGNVNLCLNGFTVTMTGESANAIYVLKENATLTIADCQAKTEDGVYSAGKLTGGTAGAITVEKDGGTLNLYDGMITGNQNADYGGAVALGNNTAFNMYGGLISDNESQGNGGAVFADTAVVSIYGGTIENNKATNGGGLLVFKGQFNMTGGAVRNNTASGIAGGLYINQECAAKISGGVISGNAAGTNGGGIYLRNNATMEITDSVISGNTAGTNGGGILLDATTATIVSSTIKDNTAGNNGGAAWVQNGSLSVKKSNIKSNKALNGGGIGTYESTLTLSADTIYKNTAAGIGGGLYINSNSELKLSGCTISGNSALDGGGIFYRDSKPLEITDGVISNNTATGNGGGIAAESSTIKLLGGTIKNNTATGEADPSRKGLGGGVLGYLSSKGAQTKTGSTIILDGATIVGNSSLKGAGIHVQDYGTMEFLSGKVDGNTASNNGGGVFIANNCSMTMSGDDSTICNNTAESGAGLALYKAEVTMTGGKIRNNTAAANGGGVYVQHTSKMVISGGAIQDNSATGESDPERTGTGGGIYVNGGTVKDENGNYVYTAESGSTLILQGDADIHGNTALKGGGVLVQNYSLMEMKGGRVCNNKTSNNGGGIFSANNAKIILSGGQVYENKAVSGGGAAVYAAEFEMTGGLIRNNYASENGGGMLVQRRSTVTISGGAIQDNSAPNSKNANGNDVGLGGGIYASGGSSWDEQTTLILKDKANVHGNTAVKGAGILLQNFASMEFKDGLVTTNTATNNGGGIFTANKSKLTMTGGIVSKNTAVQGAGMAVYEGSVTMTGGEIRWNTASENAGGMLVQKKSTVTLAGGSIHDNSAVNAKNARGGDAGLGGGVYVSAGANWSEKATLYVKGGTAVYNNKAHKGGGIMVMNYGVLEMTGGSVYNNTANNNGGGIFPANYSKANISGGKIYGNKAVSGGGIAAYRAEVNMTGGTLEDNTVTQYGAAILIQKDSQVNLKTVDIQPHTAEMNGGAIHISGGADLTMTEMTLSKHSAKDTGGALFASGDGTTVTMTDCVISENTAANGGGVAIMSHASLETNNCKINDNTSQGMAGGAYIRKAYMTMNGGEVCGNTAVSSGGGLHIEGVDIVMNRTVFVMNDGLISGNSAPKGGGVYLTRDTHSVFNAGVIEKNTADYGGGIYSGSTSLAEIGAIEVKDNTAKAQGGGLYLQRGSRTVMTETLVTGNEAKEGGGGIWVNDDITMESLTVKGNTSKQGAGGVHIAAADYDGHSYVSSVIKMSGDMYVYDNSGEFANMYISEGTYVNLPAEGIGQNAKVGITLQSGVLTRTLIGSYNYEGGDPEYIVTCGDRSVTDPEPVPVVEEAPVVEETPDEEPVQEQGSPVVYIVIAGVLLVVLIIALVLLIARKKKKNNANVES